MLVELVPAERGTEECIRALSHDAIDPAGEAQVSAWAFQWLVTTAARYGVEITGPRPRLPDRLSLPRPRPRSPPMYRRSISRWR